MLKPFENIEILDAQKYTHDTVRYWMRYVDNSYDFLAGQFITFDLPISDNKRDRYRSYSLASAPNDSKIMEVIIKRYEDGEGGSKHIVNTWEKGSIVRGRPPQGKFLLNPTDGDTTHVFLCTGVGVAPFRSMIYDSIARELPYKNMHLVYGCRKEEDLLYYDEFSGLQDIDPHLHYHVAISREEWKGEAPSRIDKFFSELILPEDKKRHYYVCGWRDMVDATRDYLKDQNIDRSQIHFELYG